MKKLLLAGIATAALLMAAPASAELKFKPGDDARFHWANFDALKKVDLKGETLTMFGPWRGDDEKLVQSILDYFREATGADLKYSSSENYEQQIVIDTEAGIATQHRGAAAAGPARRPRVEGPAGAAGRRTANWLNDNYGAGDKLGAARHLQGQGRRQQLLRIPLQGRRQGLVWYSPENFKDAGYTVPQTMEELVALSDKIVKDGGKPWCIGLGSGGATGWPATDWVEDIMLRTQPPTSTTSG